jgi:glutamine---fructose-6-phosphate transaminase (isomerizing)
MCGIFGVLLSEEAEFPIASLKGIIDITFKLSESRGKEASGVVLQVGEAIYVLKEAVSSSRLIRSKEYRRVFNGPLKKNVGRDGKAVNNLAIFGHSRLVTNGESELNANNQPVIKDGAVAVHNGIIVNDAGLWKKNPSLKKMYDVDTEVFLSLLQMFRNRGKSIIEAAKSTYEEITGAASVAVMFDDVPNALLASNTGSLYLCPGRDNKMLVFASEKHILNELLKKDFIKELFDRRAIDQVKPGTGYLIDLNTLEREPFALYGTPAAPGKVYGRASNLKRIKDISPSQDPPPAPDSRQFALTKAVREAMLDNWERLYNGEIVLRRCSKCLMPETMPFIEFDGDGVCNCCRSYELRYGKGSPLKGERALREFVEKYRSRDGEPDCIVGFSGGRDSGYGLHYIKKVLKMNPIAFTYDWGMVNDLARRNQSRICSNMGVEQIVVSADIRKKRENIRKNLKAWLKRPDLGMVPLLMAGDKQFYYFFHKIREQTGVKLFVFCGGHEIEETAFKYGFCGVPHGVDTVMNCLTGISKKNKIKMLWYYAKQYLLNPAYINKSMLDTFFAYYSTYMLEDDYLYLYHYLEWDEKKIVSTIINEFDWELAPDTKATWRTDDGTASFYNYIYMTMAGFTEFDNFRSFQIREGKLTREEALELIKEENKPRFEAIEWYARAVGFDLNRAIEIINAQPRLYEREISRSRMTRDENTVRAGH